MDKKHYDILAAAVERCLDRQFPPRRWKVARYQELVERGELKDADDFPTWLLVEAPIPSLSGHIRLRIPAQVIRDAASIEALVKPIAQEFDFAPNLARERAALAALLVHYRSGRA